MMLLESVSTMDFIGTKLADFLTYTGFANVEWANIIMIAHKAQKDEIIDHKNHPTRVVFIL